jgi:hypothetical protein
VKLPALLIPLLLVLSFSIPPSQARAAQPKAHGSAVGPVLVHRVPEGGLEPRAAVDQMTGTLHLIYFRGDPLHGNIYYVRSTDGGEQFSTPIRVNSAPGSALVMGAVRGPQLALGRDGRVHVAWNGSPKATEKSPVGGSPMLYARLNDAADGFEPQRNLMTKTGELDGGGSVAADAKGHVYVAWHGLAAKEGEAARKVWLARSNDDGKTFAPEVSAADIPALGACACCAVHAFVAADGSPRVLFRSATEMVHRDIYLLTFDPPVAKKLDEWRIGACVMSTASSAGEWVAFESKDHITLARDDGAAKGQALGQNNPKHPALASSGQKLLVAWTEKTAWNKGGTLAWELRDVEGNKIDSARVDNLPAWDYPAAVALPDGRFVIFY